MRFSGVYRSKMISSIRLLLSIDQTPHQVENGKGLLIFKIMETSIFIAICILVGVVVSFFSAFTRSMNSIESRIEDLKLEYKPKWDFSTRTIDSARKKLEDEVHDVCLDLEKEMPKKTANGVHYVRIDSGKENKDEIELRKYCLNNVLGVIGKKSYIAEADMIYHYITTGETEKRSETSKKEEL